MADEKRFYEPLKRLIREGQLQESIAGMEGLKSIVSIDGAFGAVPSPSLDSYARRKCAKAAIDAFERLSSLRIVSSDRDNISGWPSEKMFPDILLYNEGAHCFVLIEVKDSRPSSRETLTETFAYDHEIKTRLPFLAGASLIHVIVSTQWPTLLQHAITGAVAWGGKTVLCLRPRLDGDVLALEIVLPTEWEQFHGAQLPAWALLATALRFVPVSGKHNLTSRMKTAMRSCSYWGNKLGSHGFALLTSRYEPLETEYGPSQLVIWVATVNPFAFLREDDGRLCSEISELAESPTRTDPVVRSIADELAIELMPDYRIIMQGNALDWKQARLEELPRMYIPHMFSSWGWVEELVQNTLVSSGARILRFGDDPFQELSPESPELVLPLLDELCFIAPFIDGPPNALSVLHFGLLTGALNDGFAYNGSDEWPTWLSPLLSWYRLQLITAIRELNCLNNGMADGSRAQDFDVASKGRSEHDLPSEAVRWFSERLLPNEPILKQFLDLGFAIGIGVMGDERDATWRALFEDRRSAIAAGLVSLVCRAPMAVAGEIAVRLGSRFTIAEVSNEVRLLCRLNALEIEEAHFAELAQEIAIAYADKTQLRLKMRPVRLPIDVDGLREDILRIKRLEPNKTMALVINADGRSFVAEIPSAAVIDIDLESEVLLVDRSDGSAGDPHVRSWEDLRRAQVQ